MSSFEDLEKIIKMMKTPTKIAIGTSLGWHSKYWGSIDTGKKQKL